MESDFIKQKYFSFLDRFLTSKRIDHSMGVMEVMNELVDVFDLDREKALTIGILHDAAKDLSRDLREKLIAEANITPQYECEYDYVYYLHGPVGSYLVRRELGIEDKLILDAITTHTFYGRSPLFHDPHCWCMRFSDLLEPTRKWETEMILHEGTQELRELVYEGRLTEAALFQTNMIIDWYKEKGVPVHPNMYQVKEEISNKFGR